MCVSVRVIECVCAAGWHEGCTHLFVELNGFLVVAEEIMSVA